MTFKSYGDIVSYAEFLKAAPIDYEMKDLAMTVLLADQCQMFLDSPIQQYINSSWMNGIIWDYYMANAQVIYKTT